MTLKHVCRAILLRRKRYGNKAEDQDISTGRNITLAHALTPDA